MQIISRVKNISHQIKPYSNNDRMPKGKILDLLMQAAFIDVPKGYTYTELVNKLFLSDCSLFRAIQEDHVINSLPYDREFRTLIDTVVENIGQTEEPTRPVLRVLEISSSV